MATGGWGKVNVYYPAGPPDLGVPALQEPKMGQELEALNLSAERAEQRWRVIRVELPPEEQRDEIMYDVHVEPVDE
jgi:hypothetical protein